VSADAPNWSWTDWVCKDAAAFFFASGVAPFIVGQPLQKATALFQEEADSGAPPRRPLPDILCSP
jgi:hypothetical protein